MNKLNLPGVNVENKNTCQEKKLTFKTISTLMNENKLLTPPFQTDIDNDKIKEMIQSYLDNPEYLMFKNKIVIGVVNNNLYVIDGQHRLAITKKLYENHDITNDYLIFCYYMVKNDNEMKALFKEVNRDSIKHHNYISLDEFKETIYSATKEYMRQYIQYFSESKSKLNKRYSLSEFMDKLVESKYLDKLPPWNIDEIIKDIETSNKAFSKLIDYHEYYVENSSNFYKDEIESIKNNKIFSLKNNNFIDYLVNKDVVPDHHFKLQRKTISPKLRIQVWRKEYNDNDKGECPFYNCTTIISNSKNGFECGHIISHANGGETSIDNLKPICSNCNRKMGSEDWIPFQKKIKKEIKKELKNKNQEIIV